ncbi:hypothetical protein LOD99_16300 [Oopsacas minuta]|uniref:PX domain-containing protein n=1 Tax=Oopsacas minuta TaxID=111878 RepID=A0AAV7K773_9METZ|nr:hypothetical protein LOD99_16300 [Oopsacas minuta]
MQLVIPSFSEKSDEKGKYVAYDIYINTIYFASVRYSTFLGLHDVLKSKGLITSGICFPSKKFFNLTQDQIKQRQESLECYMRAIVNLPNIFTLSAVTDFFRIAQQLTFQLNMFSVDMQIFLPNGESFHLDILSTDTTEEVLLLIAEKLDFPTELMHHFNLFLVNCENENEDEADTGAKKKSKHAKYIRILMQYESPFLATEVLEKNARLVYHTLFYDAIFLSELLPYENATDIVYKEIVHECKLGLMGKPNASTQEKMKRLKQEKDLKQFLKVSRTLPYFGSIHVDNCYTDYPEEREVAIKLNTVGLRLFDPTDTYGAYPLFEFKLSRIKCWRVMRSKKEGYKIALSFEYLFDKTTLDWVNIGSDQSLYMSTVIQTIISEFLMKKANTTYKSLSIPEMASRLSRKLGTFVKSGRKIVSVSEVDDDVEAITPTSPKKSVSTSEYESLQPNEAEQPEVNGKDEDPLSPVEDEVKGASSLGADTKSNTTVSVIKRKQKKGKTSTPDYDNSPLAIKEIAVERDDAAGNKLFQMNIGDDDL